MLTAGRIDRAKVVVRDISPAFYDPNTVTISAVALGHVDLEPHNILVDLQDPSQIVAVIDSEGA